MRSIILCTILTIFIGLASGGRIYLHQAVRQAHAMHLLPYHSIVEKTAPGIQVANFYIKPYGRANLHSALGASIPFDVLRSLEHQVDSIGKHHHHHY